MILDYTRNLPAAGRIEIDPLQIVNLGDILDARQHYYLNNAATFFHNRVLQERDGWLDQACAEEFFLGEALERLPVALTRPQERSWTVPLARIGRVVVGTAL